ncbi:disease resistance protein TAO1-like isoform X21 [Carya illinoinensis]|uniref:disease resistance protein TAO1-like isoform X21 n=1 Tax=Carya illinoinensis TaxID=32201 RepID=UPI001C71CE52|nr:disease resistance protein TAO1-like isoform X21 [Carya illinoinensis]
MATQRPSSSTNSENTKKRKRDNSSCSEENETSSLPSSSTARWKHDVFLSFCGEDTRRSFTDHLYSYLKGKGILVFRDDESLERGTYISQELMQAIQESRYAIVIFSKNYAFSKWCLRELAEIVEWEEKKNLTIIPIFYHVDPSHVRKQRGTFAEAFAAHEKDPMVDIEESNTWRNAFTKVGYIKGEHINGDRYESTIIQQISEMILYNYTMPNILIHENQKIVGIDSRVGEILTLLHMESNDVRFLGIHGMGGVGKTTLAEIIYYRFYCQFKGSGFISCTRERSTTAPDLASLQKKLLSKIMQQEIHVWDHRDGLMLMSTRLRNKKVLIILDDVDCEKQLTALAGDHNWFGPGSRVIMTCRDSHLLERNKVNRYKVEPLHTTDALELFSLSAFDETHPPEDYKDLSMDFVNYAGGLPLALKVLGCFLFGRTIDFWKGARDNLKANPKPEIFDILKISFDGLEEPQKILFLDLACFSDRWIDFKKIYSADVIQVLIDKSLVSKDDVYFKERLTMHDLLKEMGRQIVRRECRQEPGRRSRLFHREDVVHVLNNDTGTDAIEGMALSCDSILGTNRTDITNAEAFSKMINLRLLYICAFGYIKGSGNPLEYMPSDKLQFLKWYGYPLKSWPRSFQPKNLIVLNMSDSCIEQLWTGSLVLPNLKELDLSSCVNLIEIPDLSGAPNLEIIKFVYCRSLCKVHPSIKVLKQLQESRMSHTRIKQLWKGLVVLPNLKELDLNSCENLIEIPDLSGAPNLEKINFSYCRSLCKQLWKGLVVLPNLKELDLNSCENLIEIPDLSEAPNLEKINFSGCRSLCKVHPSIKVLKQLQELRMSHTRIKQLWKGLVVLPNLKQLYLNFCENLIEIPDLSGAPNIEEIDFSYCRSLCKVHPSIKVLKQLQKLKMSCTRIKQLWKGLVVLPNLKQLYVDFCENLIEIPDLSGAPNLEIIEFLYCRSLCKVHPSIKVLKQLQELRMSYTQIKQLWKGLVVLPNLKELDLRFSKNLIKIPNLSGAPNLEKIDFSGCRSLCKFYPSIKVLQRQQELRMSGTRIKQLWKGLVGLDNLKYLNLSGCKNLIEIPYLSGAPNLEIINFSDCRSLCKVHPSIKKLKRLEELNMSGTRIKQLWKGSMVLPNLKVLDLSYCENLIEIPNLSGVPNLMKINFLGCRSLCKFCPSIKVPERLKILGLNKCLTRLLILDKFCLPSSFMSFSGLRELYLGGCNNISIFPSVICSLASLESLHLVGWSRLEKFPDLSRLECLKEFEAYGTAITQMPPVNLIPKNIRSLKIQRRKRMPRKSRDHLAMFINDCFLPKQSSYPTNHDIGSPVEYDMEEMQIYFGIAPFIEGWSLGSRIPEWVHNKSIGSSLQIELDGNTTSVIDCAIFIVFDCHQFHSPEATSIPRLFKETSHVTCSFCCERDDGSLEHFDSGFSLSLVEPSVCWAYARTPLKSNSSDNQSFIKISIKEISSQTPVEVKEWGLHLVCPDDTGLGLGSDLDFYRQFYSAWKCGMTRNED